MAANAQIIAELKDLYVKVELPFGACWRCGQCSEMQTADSPQAWIEDSVMRHDPAWSVKERQRRSQWNGHFSAWCLNCAAQLLKNESRK